MHEAAGAIFLQDNNIIIWKHATTQSSSLLMAALENPGLVVLHAIGIERSYTCHVLRFVGDIHLLIRHNDHRRRQPQVLHQATFIDAILQIAPGFCWEIMKTHENSRKCTCSGTPWSMTQQHVLIHPLLHLSPHPPPWYGFYTHVPPCTHDGWYHKISMVWVNCTQILPLLQWINNGSHFFDNTKASLIPERI